MRSIFHLDYSGRGERQVSSDIEKIRPDHAGRYKFSAGFIGRNDTVLDCACGVGYGTAIIAEVSCPKRVVGMDISEKAIKFARRHYPGDNIRYGVSDVFNMDLGDAKFDRIVSFETLEHVESKPLIDIFWRTLKKGGLLIISTPNEDMMPYDERRFPFHLKHYTPGELDDLLVSAGFSVVGRYTQYDINSCEVVKGTDGLFNIAVAKKE